MTDMRAGAAAPSLGDLINQGIAFAKSAKATAPYVALTILSMILPLLLGGFLGGLLGFVCALGGIVLALMASREAMGGAFAYRDSDPMAVAMLIGVAILAAIAIVIVSIPFAFILGEGLASRVIFALILLAVMVALMARIAFVLPALAAGHPIGVRSTLEQTAPYWGALAGLLVAAALTTVLFNTLFGGVGGALGFILLLIGAALSAVVSVAVIGAISKLYVERVRPL